MRAGLPRLGLDHCTFEDQFKSTVNTDGYGVVVYGTDVLEGLPFVTAAPERIPQPLLDQLAPGGRMVIPVGGFFQELKVFTKDQNGKIAEKDILPVRFVPMTGEVEKTPPASER